MSWRLTDREGCYIIWGNLGALRGKSGGKRLREEWGEKVKSWDTEIRSPRERLASGRRGAACDLLRKRTGSSRSEGENEESGMRRFIYEKALLNQFRKEKFQFQKLKTNQ